MACNSEKSFLTNNCCLKVAMVQCCDATPYVLDVSRDRVYVIFERIFIAIVYGLLYAHTFVVWKFKYSRVVHDFVQL